ncbi:MAG: asparagine synthase-related protein [Thermodesulfobacteriota bacterium]|jgi:asparagine synthase (glutamine-hydrolysing)
MPGITGIITNSSQEEHKKNLHVMVNSMMHESFYNFGSYIDESIGVYLGWVCHKDSFADCMPMWNEKRDKCLFFYGDNFADREIIDSLSKNGHKFNSDNASYLIHLFEEKGDGFFQDLNGFFHGVLIDGAQNEVIVFNDRFGMQRVYYYEKEGTLFFSSEAKSLLKLCPELREIVPASLGQLLSMGCILENNTLFKNIYALPGASLWKFKNGICERKQRYFTRNDWESQPPLEKETFYNELKETFIKILPRYLDDCRPIGMSLTGGLDTRMIMAYAHRQPRTFPCYTFGSMYRDGFDVKVARIVAESCKQEHSTIRVDKDFLLNFAQLAEKAVRISDGYLDAGSGAVEIYINRKARDIAPIRITGNYGSEVLRSIRGFRYKPPDRNLFDGDFIKHIERASEILDGTSMGNKLSFTVFMQTPWFNYNKVCVEQSQVTWRTPFMDNQLIALVYRAPYEAVTSDEISLRLVKDGSIGLSRILTNRGAGGNWQGFLSNSIRMYHEILHWVEIGYDYGMPQWLSKVDYYLTPFHLEKMFLGRNDIFHFRKWFRDELSDYLKEILLDRKSLSRPYLNKGFLVKMVNEHISGRNNYTNEINKTMTVELIHRLLFENI